MKGKHHYDVLSNSYSKDYLLDQGRKNGVQWQEHSDEGVNWSRFSRALIHHIDSGNEFHHDHSTPEEMQTMLNHWLHMKELHKKEMIPHVRAAISKITSTVGQPSMPHADIITEAYKHLDENGGHAWSEKVHHLHHINTQINKLSSKLQSIK